MSGAPTEYRIRWVEDGAEHELRATANPVERTITLDLPDAPPLTVDVTSARALPMILSHVVFRVLRPTGPGLSVEAYDGSDWLDVRDAR